MELAVVVDEVRERLADRPGALTAHRVAEALRASGRPVGDATVLAVHEELRRDVLGAGPLEPLLRLPGVTDVVVNGTHGVYVDTGEGLRPAEVRFADEAAVRRLAQRLAALGGRRLDDASPFVDVRLADGTRCHALLAPIARPGTLISLRVPRARGFSLAGLVEAGTLTPAAERLLRAVVRRRVAFVVSGGTGSGKTTLLAALLSLAEPAERIVLVEDSHELRPDHPHCVWLEARPPNLEGAGEVTVRALVRQALRMRPDRLVVGEVRGGEVVDLLAALNTGHEGGCGTLHANSVADVPARVEALALAAGLGREAAHSQFAAAVDVVLHLGIDGSGRRRLREVGVPERAADGLVSMASAVAFDDAGGAHPRAGSRPAGAAAGRRVTAALLAAAAAWVWVRPSADVPGRPWRPALRCRRSLRARSCRCPRRGAARRPSWPWCSRGRLGATVCGVSGGWPRVVETQERVLECCDLLAAELAAGQPPDAALARAAETWPALAPVAQSHAYGGDVPSALRRSAAEPGAEGMALVAAAWHVSHRTGHGLADALARVAEALRDAGAPPIAWCAASWPRRGRPPGWWRLCPWSRW